MLTITSGLLTTEQGQTPAEQLGWIFSGPWSRTLFEATGHANKTRDAQRTVQITIYQSNQAPVPVGDELTSNWGEHRPTYTFLSTDRLADGRPWGDLLVAMEAVGIDDQQDGVTTCSLEFDEAQFIYPINCCAAKVVDTGACREIFFSGITGVAGKPGEYRVLGGNIYEQTHFALMYCRQLCEKAEVSQFDVDQVDVFHLPGYQIGPVVDEVRRFFPRARLTLMPVTGFFMDGILLEIRPHATVR